MFMFNSTLAAAGLNVIKEFSAHLCFDQNNNSLIDVIQSLDDSKFPS